MPTAADHPQPLPPCPDPAVPAELPAPFPALTAGWRTGPGIRAELAQLVDQAADVYPAATCPAEVRTAVVDLLVVWQGQASGYGVLLAEVDELVPLVVDALVATHYARQLA